MTILDEYVKCQCQAHNQGHFGITGKILKQRIVKLIVKADRLEVMTIVKDFEN